MFYISSDDGASVYLRTDDNPDNMNEIIDFNSYTELKDGFRDSNTTSSSVTLVSGNSYYLEVNHTQRSGLRFFDLGIEMLGDGPNKMPFVQKLAIQPIDIVREVQNITIG